MELSATTILIILCVIAVTCFMLLSLGFALGYACFRLYNISARLAVENLQSLNRYLKETCYLQQEELQRQQRQEYFEPPKGLTRDDVRVAEKESKDLLQQYIDELPLEQQAQARAALEHI